MIIEHITIRLGRTVTRWWQVISLIQEVLRDLKLWEGLSCQPAYLGRWKIDKETWSIQEKEFHGRLPQIVPSTVDLPKFIKRKVEIVGSIERVVFVIVETDVCGGEFDTTRHHIHQRHQTTFTVMDARTCDLVECLQFVQVAARKQTMSILSHLSENKDNPSRFFRSFR